MVFARETDDALAGLVKKIDALVAENDEAKMASFINFLGSDADEVAESVESFQEAHSLEHVALVVPKDLPNGPDHLNISPDAEVTVVYYKKKRVEVIETLAPGELDAARAEEIAAAVRQALE